MLLSANMIKLHDTFGMMETFEILSKAGFEGIDFNNDVAEYHTDEHGKDFYEALAEQAKKNGVALCQAHAPFASSFGDEEKTKKRFDEIVCAMKNASYLGAPMIVVHPCTHLDYNAEGNADRLFEYNLDFYRKLIPYSKEFGIKIAIENIGDASHPTVTSTPERLCRLFDTLDDPCFTVCFDVGHCLLQKVDPAEAIKTIGNRLVNGCTHFHDNGGDRDSHTLPFYGEVDWESVMKALADIGYEGDLNYEASGFLKRVPRELYFDALCYMAKVGHYLIGRFEHYKDLGQKRASIGNLLIFGDSYSTHKDHIPSGYAFYYCDGGRSPEEPVTKLTVDKTWWWQFIKATDAKLVRNDSWSGSTICYTGYSGDCSATSSFICRYNKLRDAGFFKENRIDTIIVFGGTNDSWSGAPLGEETYDGWTREDLFSARPAICCFMDRLKKENPNSRIVFIANCDIKPEIVDCIKNAAARLDVEVVELCGLDKLRGHPTELGMSQLFDQVMTQLSLK